MHNSPLCQSFPLVASPSARIVVLGSMPGERSLKARQYYAHPHNLFWDIIGDLFGAGRNKPYRERLRMLKEHRVALWDVAFQCRRQGSCDTNIRMGSVVPNDFVALFARCPTIDTVVFNGHKAEQLFRNLAWTPLVKELGERSQRLRFVRLPSTSPAHAALTHAQKKAQWRRGFTTHFVYILQSADGRFYTGYTTDLQRRLKEHQAGLGGKFTKSFGANALLYHEAFPDKSAALKREAHIKGWSRARKAALVGCDR